MSKDLEKNNFTRRSLLCGSAAIALLAYTSNKGLTSQSKSADETKLPNIIFIMADDLGYADLSCYGRRDYATPNIDKLAAQGIRFTHAYANSSVCSATRTALMTGRYQHRFEVGLEEPVGFRDIGLEPGLPTLPSLLGDAGYHTSLIGKWHLGALPKYGPLKSGYDKFWGIRGGSVDYFSHDFMGNHDFWDGEVEVDQTGYLTELIGAKTVALIGKHAVTKQPFFMSVHFTAPHWPWESPSDLEESQRLGKSKNLKAIGHFDGGNLDTYAKMMKSLDDQVGDILQAIDKHGINENTIVIFTSDNGGERFSDTWPFTGKKTELLEGGIRVPTIMRWPARIAPEQTSDQVLMTMDWLPTLLNIADKDALTSIDTDGIDIMPLVMKNNKTDRTVFWRYNHLNQEACLEGEWKYLKIEENTFLFNIVEDPLERANLKERHPEKYSHLVGLYEKWKKSMLPYSTESFTHGYSGAELADHFGVKRNH
ncbi:MAG: sulfatase-like hydrolase/transferase [Emcibacter sp.]|nr:sulfatase-like hydrolase/transferase [Emcibacter sp.]